MLKILLKEVAINKMEMSQVFSKTKASISLTNYVMLTNMQKSVSDYVAVVRELKYNLLFESKFVGNEQQLDIAEGDAYKSIKEVWVAKMSETIFAAEFGVNSRAQRKIELRRVEKSNQQFREEWIQ